MKFNIVSLEFITEMLNVNSLAIIYVKIIIPECCFRSFSRAMEASVPPDWEASRIRFIP
jgi:hypothetical protein